MKVITLWQPWASFILWGWKTIETRDHDRFKSLLGKTICIHAGNNWDKYWPELAEKFLTEEQIKQTKENLLWHHGEILCTTKVINTRWLTKSDSKDALVDLQYAAYDPRHGLFLSDVKPIQPILVKGHQGIWKYEFKEGELVYL